MTILADAKNDLSKLGTIRLRGEEQSRGLLTQAQCESYKSDGYLVLPGAFADSQGTALLEEARTVIERIATGGEGITRHDVSSPGTKRPSPINRVIATFETGKPPHPMPYISLRVPDN